MSGFCYTDITKIMYSLPCLVFDCLGFVVSSVCLCDSTNICFEVENVDMDVYIP